MRVPFVNAVLKAMPNKEVAVLAINFAHSAFIVIIVHNIDKSCAVVERLSK